MRQLNLIPKMKSDYGGRLANTRAGRSHGRPLSTKNSMHLVLRSSQARGTKSFRHGQNRKKIRAIIEKFSQKYAIRLHSLANVGNHLHLHFQLTRRESYKPFIRAITSAIMMAVTGISRWTRTRDFDSKATYLKRSQEVPPQKQKKASTRFWDLRPFTRIVSSWTGFLKLSDYIAINQLEAVGHSRPSARFYVAWENAARAEARAREKIPSR